MWLGCISAVLNMPRLGCYLSSLLLRFRGWIDAILETSYELLCYVYIHVYTVYYLIICILFIQSVYTQRSMLQLCTCRFVSVGKCTYLSEYQNLNSPAVSSNRCPLSTFPYLSSSSTISACIPHIFTHPPKLSTCRIIRVRGDVAWNDWPLSRWWFISTLQDFRVL